MIIKLLYYDIIQQYLSGEDDKAHFEEQLTTNDELRQEYDATLAAQNAVNYLTFEQLGEDLKSISMENPVSDIPATKNVLNIKRYLSYAAVILVLIIGGMSWYANGSFGNTTLSDKHYIEPNFSTTRGDDDLSIIDQATTAFYKNDFDSCESLLLNNTIEASAQSYADYILAFSYLRAGKAEKAIPYFNKVLAGSNDLNKPSAKWHLILSLVATDKKDEAQLHLDTIISDPNNDYYSKAISLNKDLNNWMRKLVL